MNYIYTSKENVDSGNFSVYIYMVCLILQECSRKTNEIVSCFLLEYMVGILSLLGSLVN